MRKKTGGFLQKITATLLSGALAIGCLPVALATSVQSAPLAAQSSAENGMVRVYLSSLGNPSTLTLTVEGSYSVNGNKNQSISSGTSVTVGFNSSTGALNLTKGGVKTNMGTSFALRRHSMSGTNGIKIAQGRKPENPYPGDISFQSVRSGSTYKLYTIAHIYMENYLYGVLPYEMGNGAHIEALKAQAVAARTYTVRMMQSRASGYYDVVDTTNDQVYNGTPTGNANCVAAVNATKGIVVKNGSAYTATYYSASNGGQTESILNAWGTSGYDYLGVKDDPFDLANPDSVVKRHTVYSAAVGNGASLLSLLKTKAVAALKKSGYSATNDNTTLQTVKNITPHTPKYSSPSKLYTKLDFALTATTKNSSGSSVTASITVTCDIFTELEGLLGMSIQSTSNELWSVSKSGNDFTLEARRYGHGLGMSQRGAMYMGKQGYTYDQILGFYYTNCQRVRVSFTHTILSAGSSDIITTVEEPAEVEDAASTCTGVVSLTGSSASLAIRGAKSTSGKLLGVIANNSPVNVYANDGSWCFIRFGSIKGYVPTNALVLTGTAPKSTDESVSSTIGFATVNANGYLNLRASGSYSANVITTAPSGSIFTVFSKESGWAHIQFGATAAYASTDFLVFSNEYPGDAVSSGTLTATITLSDTSSVTNLRKSPSTDSAVLAKLSHGATVTVIRDDGSWAEVNYNGTVGYVMSSRLAYGDGTISGGGTDSTDEAKQSATVQVTSATIYEKQDEKSTALSNVAMGQSVVVIKAGEIWCAVRYEGMEGYMLTSALHLGSSDGNGSGTAQLTAIVATQQGALNLRMSASAGSTILTTIPKGTQITVTARGGTWTAVNYKGISGYVMSSYLQFLNDTSAGDGSIGSSGTAVVMTVSGSLNLRAQGVAGSSILRTIPRLATVTVLSRGAEWSHVTYQGTTGYVMTVFLLFTDEGTESGADSGILQARVTTVSGSLNLRTEPSLNGWILAQIPQHAIVNVELKGEGWSQVSYGGQTGHVMTQYLTFLKSENVLAVSLVADEDIDEDADLDVDADEDNDDDIDTEIDFDGDIDIDADASEDTIDMDVDVDVDADDAQSDETEQDTENVVHTEEAENTENTEGADDLPETDEEDDVIKALVNTGNGTLNLRAENDENSNVLATIPHDTEVTVLSYEDSWCRVGYDGIVGYAMTRFLSIGESAEVAQSEQSMQQTSQEQAQPEDNHESDATVTLEVTQEVSGITEAQAPEITQSVENKTAWVVTPSGALNLRESASLDAQVLIGIPRLSSVVVVGESGQWSQVTYREQVGYVLSEFLSAEQPSAPAGEGESVHEAENDSSSAHSTPDTPVVSADPVDARPNPILDDTMKPVAFELEAEVVPSAQSPDLSIKLMPECSEQSEPLNVIPDGKKVKVLMQGEVWCQIVYLDQVGYCLTECLSFLEE